MQSKHYVLGLVLAISLAACGKEEKTKTVTVENPKTVEELNKAKQEKAELEKQLKLTEGTAEKLKATQDKLTAAETSVTDLTAAGKTKDEEIAKLKKQLETANDAEKVAKLQADLDKAVAEKAAIQTQLDKAVAQKTALEEVVKKSQEEEAIRDSLLDYALKSGSKTRDALGQALEADVTAAKGEVDSLNKVAVANKEAIAAQAAVVLADKAALEDASKNLQGVYDGLKDRQDLTDAEKETAATLKAYFDANAASAQATKAKGKAEEAAKALTADIEKQNAVLKQATTERSKLVDLLVAETQKPAPADKVLNDLTTKIKAQDTIIANAKKALTENGTKLDAQNAEVAKQQGLIVASEEARTAALAKYNDTKVKDAADKVTASQTKLDELNKTYQETVKKISDAQSKQETAEILSKYFQKYYAPKAAEPARG